MADLATELQQKNCGENKECRVIVAPKKIEKQGACLGTFMGSLPCLVSYYSSRDLAAMNLTCGEDFQKPVVDQNMQAEALGYNVAVLIKRDDGQDVVKNDPTNYSMFSGTMLDLMLTETDNNGLKATSASVTIHLQNQDVQLTNVVCR